MRNERHRHQNDYSLLQDVALKSDSIDDNVELNQFLTCSEESRYILSIDDNVEWNLGKALKSDLMLARADVSEIGDKNHLIVSAYIAARLLCAHNISSATSSRLPSTTTTLGVTVTYGGGGVTST
ncbi:hypothetical protein L1887_26417 [Cichorium endivia]|nr:hypothetical protein L1887_26417 [Cichorium endivia]